MRPDELASKTLQKLTPANRYLKTLPPLRRELILLLCEGDWMKELYPDLMASPDEYTRAIQTRMASLRPAEADELWRVHQDILNEVTDSTPPTSPAISEMWLETVYDVFDVRCPEGHEQRDADITRMSFLMEASGILTPAIEYAPGEPGQIMTEVKCYEELLKEQP